MTATLDAADTPLAGIRVLDLTTTIFGPYTTQVLADLGADVIKVEGPEGDPVRFVGPARSRGMSALFLACNRNKRSLMLDLKTRAGADAFWSVIDSADMLVHNMRPRKIEALGFGPDAVLARRPGIVYGGLHGYRADGPYGDRPAYDDVIQGQSGIAGMFQARDGAPALAPTILADKTAALIAANGLLAALLRAKMRGKGGYVECSMFEAMVSYNLVDHFYGQVFDPPQSPPGYPRVLSPHRRPHATADGHICMLAYTDRQWKAFWSVAGAEREAADPRFSGMTERAANYDALYETVGRILKQRPTGEWMELLPRAEIPCGPVNSLDALLDDPHLNAIGFFRAYHHPEEGAMTVPDTPWRVDRAVLPLRTPHPRLGAHTAEILAEVGCPPELREAALSHADMQEGHRP